jgi:hypothetical protein
MTFIVGLQNVVLPYKRQVSITDHMVKEQNYGHTVDLRAQNKRLRTALFSVFHYMFTDV